jgi:leader peptidase (prepilin peptidase)/N-methyltransferase
MTILFVGLFALCFGSFFNVLIYRLPLNKSIVKPNSFCPNCNHKIKWYHNIPLFSYFFLRAKCAYCKCKISAFYPIVEFVTLLVTLLLYLKLGLSSEFIFITIVFYLLIVLSFIDLKYKAVPDYLLLLIFVSSLFVIQFDFLNALKNGFIFAGFFIMLDFILSFYIQNIKYKLTKDESLKTQKALGEGDIPIVFVIGAILGIKAGFAAIFLGALCAIIPSIYQNVWIQHLCQMLICL